MSRGGGKFFSSLNEIKKSGLKFDFVSANHMLCVADNLVQILETVHDILTDQGVFFVMDTDFEVHPWLLYDIEYSSYFTNDYLKNVLSGFGFEILNIDYEREEKEIAVFCSKKEIKQKKCIYSYQVNKEIYEQKVVYLNRVIDTVHEYVEANSCIGIFGTSIAGVWLSEIITKGELDCANKKIFYVEEDEEILRQKTGVNGYPIYRLEEIEEDAVVFLPFPRYIAESIKRRCKNKYYNCKFVIFG